MKKETKIKIRNTICQVLGALITVLITCLIITYIIVYNKNVLG